jgi:hypothetical protein
MFKNKDFILANIYLLLGVLFGYYSLKLEVGSTSNIGPGYFPLIISFFLILISFYLYIKCFMNRIKNDDKMIYDIKAISLIYTSTIIFAICLSGIPSLKLKPMGLLIGIFVLVYAINKENRFKLFIILSTISYILFIYLLKININFLPFMN